MKLKIDRGLVPIKAHFFFFFAALGPLLPQMNVFGRQLGVSPGVMGLVTAVLPLLWAAAKPLFGYVVDYWPAYRKLVFMLLIVIMTGSYCGLWFIPMPDTPHDEQSILEYVYKLNDTIYLKKYTNDTTLDKYSCHWNCSSSKNFAAYLSNTTYVNTLYVDDVVTNESCSLFHMDYDDEREGEVTCTPKVDCNLLCFEDSLDLEMVNRSRRAISEVSDNHLVVNYTKEGLGSKDIYSKVTKVTHRVSVDEIEEDVSFYMTGPFWAFVVLMCLGTVAFNVANCIGDAVCFDVLGPDRAFKYGAQRAWGTAGYGITALLGGWLVDLVSGDGPKQFTPAFILALVATAVDLASCRALKLPPLSSPDDSGKALRQVLKMPKVLVFILFAVVAGTFDSFIIYYMFWFLEELAESTGHTAQIKLIEGVVVAGQSFIGELLFFYFSGRIIKRWGYGLTMSFSLLCYGLRMVFISMIQHPWHLVLIESIMQGPTYALCYSCIVGYAAHVAPEGYSAAIQGIVAGMDDGVGFAFGSLIGGQLYTRMGGRGSFRALAATAVIASAVHAILHIVQRKAEEKSEKRKQPAPSLGEEGEKMLPPLPPCEGPYRDSTVTSIGEKTDR